MQVASAARRAILQPQLDSLMQPGKRVLLLTAADPTTSVYSGMVRKLHRRSAPSEWHMISSTLVPQNLRRTSANSFVLERISPAYTAGDTYAEFFTDRPLQAGQRFRLGDIRITVENADRGRPMRTRYEFATPLEHPSLVFLTQTARGLIPLDLPAIGESSIVQPPALAFDLLR
jgi:hypothetical protein